MRVALFALACLTATTLPSRADEAAERIEAVGHCTTYMPGCIKAVEKSAEAARIVNHCGRGAQGDAEQYAVCMARVEPHLGPATYQLCMRALQTKQPKMLQECEARAAPVILAMASL